MRLNEIGGHYNPSFFNMFLETNEDISLAINKYSATFMHEFIHYIQDIILPYNIRMNLSRLLWFSNIQKSAIKNGYIICPFNDWDSESKTVLLQFKMSIGINRANEGFINKVLKMDDAITTFEKASGYDGAYSMRHREFKIYKYNMRINNEISYNLGARDLLEYIAYKIETKHFATEMRLPQLPYESIDLLFAHYGLSHVPDDIRLCIAEVCLYNDNPVRFLFVNFLENEESRQNIASLSFNQVYKQLLSLEFEATDGVKETITHKTNRRLKQFENVLGSHYTNFAGIKKWIKRVNTFAETELSNRFIFANMYKMDTNDFLKEVSWIISNIGLPLVMNSNEVCVSLQPQQDNIDEFVQFYILQKFFNHVSTKQRLEENRLLHNICPIYNFCRANEDICDENCNCNLQPEQLYRKKCPYFRFLQSYGLTDVRLK